MISIAPALAAALLFAGASAHTITLKQEAFVKGPDVLLGDVAEIQGPEAETLAAISLMPAALPGSTTHIHTALVESRLDQSGVDAERVAIRGPVRTAATTRYLEITREMIAADLRDHIGLEMPWDPARALVEVAPPNQDYRVSDGKVEFRWQRNPQYTFLGAGVFRGDVLVDGRIERSFHAKANIQAYGDVVVAATDLRRGARISVRDLTLETRELAGLDRRVFFDVADVEGYIAKTTIMAGQPITEREVQPPVLVKRNQMVLVSATKGALTVTTRAQAIQNGAEGDYVTLRNPASRDEFSGLVRKDGSVAVE